MKKITFLVFVLCLFLELHSQQTPQLMAKYSFENNLKNEIDTLSYGVALAQPAGIIPAFVTDNERTGKVLHQFAGISTSNSLSYTRFTNPLLGIQDLTGGTVSVWIKRNDNNVFGNIWSMYDNDLWGNNNHDRLFLTPNAYLGYNGPNGWFDCNWPDPTPTGIIKVGEWAMLTVTVDATGFKIYLNGTIVFDVSEQFRWAPVATAPSVFNYSNVLNLFKNAENFYFGFGAFWGSADLLIDDLSIYKGVLNSDQIKDLYNTSTVDSQWKLDAEARIEQNRKENVTIRVTQNGNIIEGAKIEMKMKSHEFLFGANIFEWESVTPPQGTFSHNTQFSDMLNFATTRFYWSSYEHVKDMPNYAYTDAVANWTTQNDIQLKGHPLLWNSDEPTWVSDFPTNADLFLRIKQRVKNCIAQFKDNKVGTWDVINELVNYENYRTKSPRISAVIDAYTDATFAKQCFRQARIGNPNATLLINDYVPDSNYVNLLKQLKDNGKYLFDVVGIQSHTHVNGEWNNQKIWDVCELFKQFGKPIHFSELTVLSTLEKVNWTNINEDVTKAKISTKAGEEWQKNEAVRFYTMLFSHPSVGGISWWDFSDKNAWFNAPAGLLRNDFSPKPAYTELKKLIKEDWATNTTLTTNGLGEASIRAFRGKYNFIVTLPNNQVVEYEFLDTISKAKVLINLQISSQMNVKNSKSFENSIEKYEVYSNNNNVTFLGIPEKSNVKIYNLTGMLIKEIQISSNNESTSFNFPSSIYIAKIYNKDDSLMSTQYFYSKNF